MPTPKPVDALFVLVVHPSVRSIVAYL